jgi:peptidoglycan hydrolase-like protein with peptidoglycan-binding domain
VNLNTQSASIDGVDLKYLNFSPAILQVQDANSNSSGVQITPGGLMSATLVNSVDNSLGRVTFSQVNTGGTKYTGSGVLATISFRALTAGNATVSLNYTPNSTTDSNVASLGSDVLSSVSSGSFTVISSLPDLTSPTVSITAPTNNATVSGSSVSIAVSATDPTVSGQTTSGIASVQLKIDGVSVQGGTLTTAPYTGTWNTTNVENGAHTITAVASDVAGNSTTSSVVNVTVSNVANRPPVLTSIGAKAVNENATLSFTVSATDPDNDTLTYSTSALPAGATFISGTRTFSFTPSYLQSGSYPVTFNVSDGSGGTDSEIVTITVNNVNRAPSSSAGNDQTITLSHLATLAGVGSDPDGQTVTYLWSKVSETGGSATLSNAAIANPTVSFSAAGVYTLRLTVSDGVLSSSDNLIITVNPETVVTTDDDIDGVPNSSDKCPNTPSFLRSKVNSLGCPLPKMTEFTVKTDLAAVDLNEIQSLELGNTEGKISFESANGPYILVKTNGTAELDLDSNIEVAHASITLNSTNLSQLNKPAKITFNNINFLRPTLLRDGSICATCSVVSYLNHTFVFTVPGFSTYTLTDEPLADTTLPTVSFITPNDNDSFTPKEVKLSALATDESGIAGVRFAIDGVYLGDWDTTSPYEATWNATIGQHILSAVAKDPSDNSTTATITVTVNAVAPLPCTNCGGGGGGGGGSFTPTVPQAPVLVVIPGCGNKTTGFSLTTGRSCITNRVTTTKYNFGAVTLKDGSRGPAVVELQRFLNDTMKLGLVLDGVLGPKTIAVIKKWQSDRGLVPDGLIGNKTKAMMNAIATGTNPSTGSTGSPQAGSGPLAYNLGIVTLRDGSRGEAVKELQRFLNDKLKLGLVVDGKLGPKTIAVIKKWQRDHKLVVDGLVGNKTKAMMNGEGR